jgi:hypothetical protein
MRRRTSSSSTVTVPIRTTSRPLRVHSAEPPRNERRYGPADARGPHEQLVNRRTSAATVNPRSGILSESPLVPKRS